MPQRLRNTVASFPVTSGRVQAPVSPPAPGVPAEAGDAETPAAGWPSSSSATFSPSPSGPSLGAFPSLNEPPARAADTAPVNPIRPRSFQRDGGVFAKIDKLMSDEITAQGKFAGKWNDTPAIDIVPSDASVLQPVDDHLIEDAKDQVILAGGGKPALDFEGPCKYTVKSMPKDGILDLTLMCPVSGHCGLDDARRWAGLVQGCEAEANLFSVSVTWPDGKSFTISDLKAKGFVTPVDLSIPLKPGKIVINYWPNNSGGVSGYPDGRTVEIDVPEPAPG
jgi:hypothetical protein